MSTPSEPKAERRQLAIRVGSGFAELSYVAYEPPGARRTVLCLHDFLGNSADFTRLATMLAGHGFRVVCPDMPGRGQSAYLSVADYNPHTYLVSLLTMAESFNNKRLAVIGKGWGALLALGLAHMPEVAVSRLVLADLGFPWKLDVDESVAAAAQGPGFASLEEARRLLAGSSEFKGMAPWRALPLIDGRLRQTQAGYGFDFDPALLSGEATAKFAKVRTRQLFDGLKGRLLYLSGGKISPGDRERLRGIISAAPNRATAENVSSAPRVHFASGHELLVTVGFLMSRFLPPV